MSFPSASQACTGVGGNGPEELAWQKKHVFGRLLSLGSFTRLFLPLIACMNVSRARTSTAEPSRRRSVLQADDLLHASWKLVWADQLRLFMLAL